MKDVILENIVKSLKNAGLDKLDYESLLGDSTAVKAYANTGLACGRQFSTVIAIVLHEYTKKSGKSAVEYTAYREALIDFVEFFRGCVEESNRSQPTEPKKDK